MTVSVKKKPNKKQKKNPFVHIIRKLLTVLLANTAT